MIKKVKESFLILDNKSRIKITFFVIMRCVLSIFDLVGITLVGLLLAKSASYLSNTADKNSFTVSGFNLTFLSNFSISVLTGIVLILFISKSFFSAFFMKQMAKTLALAESKLATLNFHKLLNADFTILNKKNKSDSIYSLTYSPGFAVTNLITVATIILSETVLLVLILLIFAIVNWKITLLIAIYFFVIGVVIQYVVGKKFRQAGQNYAVSAIESSQFVEDSLVAYREIKTLNKQKYFSQKFETPRFKMAESTSLIGYLTSLPRFIVESALMVGAVLLVLISFRQGESVEAAQTLGIFLTGGLRIMASMLPLQNSLGTTKQLLAQAEKFLDLEKELKNVVCYDSSNALDVSNSYLDKPLGIKISNLNFKFPISEETSITDVSLEIKPGAMVAFIGPSGAGKSTLADLISGILRTYPGEIEYYIDSRKIDQIQEIKFGYVPQRPGIISGTVLQNIALGVDYDDIDFDRLTNATKLANLDDLIKNLDGGINYNLGANSDALSGGQLQRIGLARALYAKPNLLILDEATSALDVDSEATVTSSLLSLKGTCTSIVIAHRLTTIQNADWIFVVENGKIRAQGNFSDLATSNDLVARYVELSELEIN